MIINLKLISRTLFKDKSYPALNIIGLAIGFACAFVVYVWVNNEFSYDKQLANADRIYRLTFETNTSGNRLHFARCWKKWISQLPGAFPQVEELVWLEPSLHTAIKAGDNKFYSDKVFATDSNFLKVFGINILAGDPDNMLKEPLSAVISSSIARKCYKGINPVGQIIFLSGEYDEKMVPYSIKGVMQDLPAESHIHFDVLTSVSRPLDIPGWAYVYLLLRPETKPNDILAAFSPIVNRLKKENEPTDFTPHLQKITEIHLFSDKDREVEPNGNITNVYLFIFIALILMLISWVNYYNLNKARLLILQKQIKIQLILGSDKKSLVFQSLAESGLYVLLAFILAVTILDFISNPAISFFGLRLMPNGSADLVSIWPIILVLLIISVLSGSLPLIQNILRRQMSLMTLKEAPMQIVPKLSSYGMLMIVQFCLSISLMITSITIYQQKDLMISASMGKMRSNILVFKKQNWEIRGKYQAIREQALRNPLIKSFTACIEEPAGETVDVWDIESSAIEENRKDRQLYVLSVEDNFLDFFGIQLLSGRNFVTFNPARKGEDYILNETAVKKLGWTPEQAIGKPFKLKFPVPGMFNGGTVVGVVCDFNFNTLKQKIKPYVFFQKPEFYQCFMVEVNPVQKKEAISYLKSVWEKELPEYPFQIEFINDLYNTVYQKEFNQAKLTTIFSILAIAIICLGLYSVTSVLTARRTKEIGIRKVNGAGIRNIIFMLSSEFTLWFAISFVIACPVTFLVMNKWLENFVYKTEIKWWFYIVAGFMVLLVSLVTVCLQSLRAARRNPLEALRYE
ncbi:MAG: ABC transporter permease [Bacteroidota bacterium]